MPKIVQCIYIFLKRALAVSKGWLMVKPQHCMSCIVEGEWETRSKFFFNLLSLAFLSNGWDWTCTEEKHVAVPYKGINKPFKQQVNDVSFPQLSC